MKPDGARYEHEGNCLDKGCVFLGTYHQYDLWAHPTYPGSCRFDMVMTQTSDADIAGWEDTWHIHRRISSPELQTAYGLAVQRGYVPVLVGP